MDITELFFNEAHSPKLVYSYVPGDDAGNTIFRCERMNAAAELWIRENSGDGNFEFLKKEKDKKLEVRENAGVGDGSSCVDSVFESGVFFRLSESAGGSAPGQKLVLLALCQGAGSFCRARRVLHGGSLCRRGTARQ